MLQWCEAGHSLERTPSVLRLNPTGRWQKTPLVKMNGAPDADIAVFTEALRLPPEERDRYLDKACKGDAEFRRRVEALIQAYEQAGDFLGRESKIIVFTIVCVACCTLWRSWKAPLQQL